MKISDMLRMSLSNLFKRKVRTILTVLGVVIGVASIVVMVSLGLGLKKATMDELENYASLTSIEVRQPYNMDGAKDADKKFLDDALIQELENIQHVTRVDPFLEVDMMAKYGNYESYLNLQGTTLEAIQDMRIKVGEGDIPKADAPGLELFYGNMMIANFYNAKTHQYYWDTGVLADIDLMKDSIFYIFDVDSYYGSQNSGGEGEGGASTKKAKKYLIPAAGVAAGGVDEYYNYSYNVYCDIEKLIPMLKKEFKGRAIPGQPTTSKGKPYKNIYYSTLKVNVDSMENVAAVNQIISDMGYQTYNDAEWIEQQQQSLNMIQAVLGGIGAVSLLVAAIGITNTMMMSIYERTKEIGIMKVLGCDMRNIGALFLVEAGFIGFIGGVVGMLLSYGMSFAINTLVKNSDMGIDTISYIPLWLIALSLLFAILVGMIAGFFPARRAMRLSPLAAIRNE